MIGNCYGMEWKWNENFQDFGSLLSTQIHNTQIFHIITLYEKIMFKNLLSNDFYEEYKFLAKHTLDLI